MALQLRRGTNAQRLGMTPANGELIFVTDYALVSTSVTSINTSTETLSTTVAHGLSVNQQVKYIGDTLNGLTADQVYFVKTAPTITDFTLSTSLGGGTLNITGSFTVPLVFAKTPTDAAGAPVGTGVSPLWLGDGSTVGGVIASNLNLDDLLDVVITNPVNEGQFLWYDGTNWVNENETTVDTRAKTLSLTRRSTTAGESYENDVALRLQDRLTDTHSYLNDEGGPAIEYQRSSGVEYTKTYVSGGAPGAFTVTLDNVINLVVGDRITGTGLTNLNGGVLITVIAGNQLTLNTAFTAQAAGSYTVGSSIPFGAISMEWFGTTNVHRYRVVTTTDAFTEDPPNTYPNTNILIESTKNATNINEGVLYVDATNDRVGINKTSPTSTLDVVGNGFFTGSIVTTDTNDAINPGSGSIQTLGGVGITKKLHVGGTVSVDNADNATSTTTGSIQTDGGVGMVKDLFVGGLATVTGDVAVNGGDLTTTQTTFNLVNATATTLNIGGAATQVNIGVSGAGAVDIRPTTDASSQTTGALQVAGGVGIVKNLHVGGTVSVDNTNNATSTFTGSIQTDGGIGVVSDIFVGGIATITGDVAVNGGDLTTTAGTGNLFNTTATTVNIGGAATTMSIGNASGTVTIPGNLTVNGTTTTINSQTLLVKDKNIEMGVVTTPTDVTADGGGIILKGTTDKTILYDNALGVWVSNIGFNTTGSTLGNVTVGVVDDNTISTTTGDLAITATGSNGVTITSGTTEPTSITRNSTATNTVIRTLTINAQSTGTPAVGFGNSLEYEIETAVGNTERAGYVSVVSTDVTPASEDFTMNFGLMTAGATAATKMALNNAGDLQIDGDLTVTGNNINSSTSTALTFAGADVTVAGDLAVTVGNITTTATTATVFNTTATTLNIGGAATAVNIGAATGSTIINADLNVNGTILTLDANNAGAGANSTIAANRGSSGADATLVWDEITGFWTFNNNVYGVDQIVAGVSLGTNGNNIYFNNEDSAAADCFIHVKRPSVADAQIKWNETSDRWQTSVDSSTYINIPNQNLDTTDDVSFAGVSVDTISTYNTQTTTTTALTTVTISSTSRASQKAVIKVIDNVTGEMQMLEALAFRKGTTGYLTTYAEMSTSAALATFTVIGTGSLTSIQATPLSTNSTTFTVARISLD